MEYNNYNGRTNLVYNIPPSSSLLLGEVSGVSGCGDRVSSLLPLCAETLRHKHYPQHLNLLETLLKLVRLVRYENGSPVDSYFSYAIS